MDFRKLGLILTTIAVLAPAIANASPEKQALNACARAFATSIAAAGATAPTYKLDYRENEVSGASLEFFQRAYTFDLNAADPKTGSTVAHASCSTNSHGTVITLAAVRADSKVATLAAQ
jgi:hypothetical protein